ncbi:zinc-binding dehydrogenase [Streptomyces sp. NBS 14/10]|uniref:quinone oxidoreductase family protein n=1 Tax=Streptomyces sp. NBS 14/10 TaxID=1945643 RepID=UPI0015C6933F|nr:zinc-binding dehydrogenase [Streptomyces sp. NBS 14/10]KAK1182037.1 zinc-binding dehydrogenase [Streptomyces sp. NBS 14/10]
MKAVVLDTDDRFHLIDIDQPAPGPGEVAIRVQYAGIQWGDVLLRGGHFPVPRPFVPGFEAAGHIVAVGEGVADDRLGQQVTALTSGGAYAEVVVAPAALTFDTFGTDLRTAAGCGWAAPTAYDLINTVGRVRPGESVLIHAAAGGVGSLAAQVARTAGAGRIVGVVKDAQRASYAAQFGYDQLITREEFTQEFTDAPDAPDAPDQELFDLILDPVGGPVRETNLRRLAPHGRLAIYGNLATFEPVALSANDLLMSGKSALTYNSNLLSQTHPDRLAESAREALQLVAAGRIRPDVTAEYEMADLAEAVQRLADGATHGKSVLRIAA